MIRELPFIHFDIDGQDYYGGDQEWFDSHWARQAGCASVLAANLYCVYEGQLDMSYENYRMLMDEMFTIFTPGVLGFPFYNKFAVLFIRFMMEQGVVLEPVIYGRADDPGDDFAFIKDCIDHQMPIGMLVLTHRHKDLEEDRWHWMCITGYVEEGNKKEVIVSSCGEKVTFDADVLFDPHPLNVVRMVSFKSNQDQSAGGSSDMDSIS